MAAVFILGTRNSEEFGRGVLLATMDIGIRTGRLETGNTTCSSNEWAMVAQERGTYNLPFPARK